MKTLPALPTVTAHEVIRIGEVNRVTGGRKGSSLSRLPAPARPITALPLVTKPVTAGVIRVVNKRLGISCPCATAEVAAQLTQFFSR